MYIGEDYGGPFPPPPADRLETRRELSRIIESALSMLDALDTIDPDREPDGDELDASWPEESGPCISGRAVPQEDDEPSLGWHAIGGGCWRFDDGSDREWDALDEPDGYDSDREPALAAPESFPRICYGGPLAAAYGFSDRLRGASGGDQSRWAIGCANDREEDAGDDAEAENEHGGDILDQPHDDDDSGIADRDGLWEQAQREVWA
ncbi:hypothetical protein [Ancylobacter sp. IITR112]|uniref:hypothetical protein n=1 Tax=Ancylobacter sp. IITR112 TaxID=3138073 RepID=UPI00352A952C